MENDDIHYHEGIKMIANRSAQPNTGPAPVIETSKLTYTVDEAAYLLNLSRGVTYQYVRQGTIPAERIGRRWVIPRRRFHAWLDGLESA